MIKIYGCEGLGDNLFQRGLLHDHAVYLATPWPELWVDTPVRCIKPVTTLRTQKENADRSTYAWHDRPTDLPWRNLGYGGNPMPDGIIECLAKQLRSFGLKLQPKWSLPPDLPMPIRTDKPIAVVRPVTVRTEWRNESRNPRPEYVAEAAAELRVRGFHVVSIAHLADGKEWALDPLPPADTVLHHGELDVRDLLGLVQNARAAVGGGGWLIPAAICAGTPLFVVLGGNGAHNAPEVVTHPTQDLSRVGWATPDRYCRCDRLTHDCDRTITGFGEKFSAWADRHLA